LKYDSSRPGANGKANFVLRRSRIGYYRPLDAGDVNGLRLLNEGTSSRRTGCKEPLLSNIPPPPPPYGNQPQQPYPQQIYVQQPKANAWAIISLILGILGCVPFVTSLCAIITGFIGVAVAKPGRPGVPAVGGKGRAIAGIILGFIGLIACAGIAGFGYWGAGKVQEAIIAQAKDQANATGSSFLSAVANSDAPTVSSVSSFTTSDFSQSDLDSLKDKVKQLGQYKYLKIADFKHNQVAPGKWRLSVAGTASFEKGNQAFSSSIVADLGTGGTNQPSLKIEEFKLK
jgi:hypothetical protein